MKNLFKLGAVATLSFGMAACSNDVPAPEGPAKAESDQTQYVCIALSSPAQGTRAFDDGIDAEHFVKRLDFVWYDANGVPTAQPTQFTDGLNDKFVTEGSTTDNVTKIWKSIVPVSLVQGQNLPAQVICLVNADQADVNRLISLTLDELRDETNDKFYSDGFQMSNSVYFGTNTLTGQPNQRLCATPVNKLYKTETDANAALTAGGDEALLDIYVERKAAKITLNMDADAPKGYTLANGSKPGEEITLTYHPEYWFMNATDKKNYVTKRYGIFPEGATEPVMKPTFEQINNALAVGANWATWNDQDNFRSYWGTSPSYFDNTYPMVSDEIDDLDDDTTDPKPDDGLSLKYYTYNEVKTQGAATGYQKQAQAAANGAFGSTIYTFETTTAIAEITNTNKNPAATVASAVVVGHYTAGDATTATTFYVNRNLGKNGTYYANEEDARNSMKELQRFIFTDQGTTVAPMNNFTLQHPKQAVRAKLTNPNIAGRLVALQLTQDAINNSANNTVPLYFYNGTTYKQITTADDAVQANAALIGAGYMDMFYEGLAFFSVPIRHLNWNDAYYSATDGYKWADMKVGALGVVRNHSYSLTINKIEGLGTGLRDDDQPIVPPVTSLKQYVAVRLNILAWNVVNSWNVDL